MTVKEIFDLRKQGKIEEAYEAIRPMYRVHKGRYTTLCMFWTAADVLKLRLEQGRTEEATKIYKALQRMLHRVEEITKELDKQRDRKGTASNTAETKDVVAKKADENLPWENNKPQHSGHSATAFIRSAEHRLAAIVPAGSPSSSSSLHFSGESAPVSADSPSSSSSLHFSGESAPVLSGSPAAAVPAGSPAVPPASSVLSDSPASSVLSDSSASSVLSDSVVSSVLSDSVASSVLSDSVASSVLSDSSAEGLNAGQHAVLDCIRSNPGLRVPKLSELTNIPSKSIERHIKVLIERNLIEHLGSKKTGGYYIK